MSYFERPLWLAIGGICLAMMGPRMSVGQSTTAPATIVVHGRVWTADREQPWAQGVAIGGERILACGTRNDVDRRIGQNTRVIEAGDGLVVPGLIDSHIHLVDGGFNLGYVQLRDAATREEFVRRIAEFARGLEEGHWILGGDWDHTLWGGELPSRDWIDAVTPNNPVWINRLDGHMGLANSAALAEAEVGDDVEDVEGGEIVRDAAGRPTGIFKDDAMAHDRERDSRRHARRAARCDRGRDGLPGRAWRHVCASHGFVAAPRDVSRGEPSRAHEDAHLRVPAAGTLAAIGP